MFGTTRAAHPVSLAAMEYLQSGARRTSVEIASALRRWSEELATGTPETQIEIG